MTIRTKLIVLLVLPLLAVGWLGLSGFRQSLSTADGMRQVMHSADLSVAISALVHETQKERGMTAGYYGSGGKKFVNELEQQRKVVDQRRAELEAFLESFDTDGYDPAFVASLDLATQRLGELEQTRESASAMSIPAGQAIGYYTQTNAALLDTVGLLAHSSEDPEMTTQLVAYQSFLKGKERAGIERAVLSNTFAQDKFGPGMYKKFTSLVAEQATYLGEFKLLSGPDDIEAFEQVEQSALFSDVEGYRGIANEHMTEGGFGVDAKVWFDTITAKINGLKAFEDGLSQRLSANAAGKKAEATRASWFYGGTTLATVLIVVALGMVVIRSILQPLRAVIDRLKDIAEGEADLTQQADEARRDELGVLASWFNAFVRRIHDVMVDVSGATQDVKTTAATIAESSREVNQSIDEQSNQVTQISAAIEQMSASVIEVARKAADAANSARVSGETAEHGGQIVRDTIQGMQGIDHAVSESAQSVQKLGDRGEQIGEVITVINDIADQTNLLALNAAIEAARAGEAGRGFAVVADEVRKLADRTTKATDEIADSIRAIQADTDQAVDRMSAGQEHVKAGVGQATAAGQSLQQIVEAANEVASMVQAIAAASEEQSIAGEEVSRSVQQISAMTRDNSVHMGESAAAASELRERSDALSELVGHFKLDPNTHD